MKTNKQNKAEDMIPVNEMEEYHKTQEKQTKKPKRINMTKVIQTYSNAIENLYTEQYIDDEEYKRLATITAKAINKNNERMYKITTQ